MAAKQDETIKYKHAEISEPDRSLKVFRLFYLFYYLGFPYNLENCNKHLDDLGVRMSILIGAWLF